MGQLIIEQWVDIGLPDSMGQPIYRDLVVTTNDTTTSSSDETVVVDGRARYISIFAVEAHRVAINSTTTGSLFAHIGAGERRDIALPKALGVTISYRTDA